MGSEEDVMKSHQRSVLHRAAALTASGTLAVWCVACSGGTADKVPTSTASSSGSASNSSSSAIRGISLDCSNPIGSYRTVDGDYQDVLGTVGIHTKTTLQAFPTDETAPHRLFAKTGLFLHSGRAATLTVPKAWAKKVSIAWGTNAAEWTTTLHIRACPTPPGGAGSWLVFPGGFSLDQPACVPRSCYPTSKKIVQVSVGVPCPS